MNNSNNNNLDTAQFQDFISALSGAREVGLVVAENAEELDIFSEILEKNRFGKLSSVLKYKNVEHGWYIVVNNDSFKEVYDFVCQYPLTTISLFDNESANTIIIKPDYEYPVIILVEKDILKTIQENYDLLGRTGMAYRAR